MGGHRDAESRCAVARGAAGHGFWKGATAAQCWGRHRTAPLKMVTTASLCYVSCHTKQKTKKPKNPQKSQNKASRASPQASGPDFPAWSFSVPRGCGWGTGWGGVVLGVQPLSPPPGRKAPWGPRLPPTRGRRPQSPRKKGQAPRSPGPREPRAGLGRGRWPPPLGRAPPAAPAIRGVMIASLTRSSRL